MPRGGKRPGAGRPKGSKDRATKEQGTTLSDLAKKHTDTALKALVDIAQTGSSEAARVAAASALLDRGYGRPRQTTEITGKDGGPIETKAVDLSNLTDDELVHLERLLAEARGRSEGAGSETPRSLH